ncbi:unnamed protein product [Closterium sp. NIES-53]
MGRDVALGEGEQKGEGKGEGEGAGGKVRKGEGAGDEEGRGEGEGDMRVGEDEVAFSLEFSLPLHSRYRAVQPALSPPLSPLSLLRSASHSLLPLASLPWDLQPLKAALHSNHSTLSSLSRAITGSCS